uniref:Uncharacterized protein n=1 Tax=Anguilla anguilla TaxID=7936 RepID=A0A0E9SRV0_ANGAN
MKVSLTIHTELYSQTDIFCFLIMFLDLQT